MQVSLFIAMNFNYLKSLYSDQEGGWGLDPTLENHNAVGFTS